MNISGYSIDLKDVIESIKKNDYKQILIQLPEGLKQHSSIIYDEIEKMYPLDIYFLGDPCYGACDIPCTNHLESLGIQAVIQIGHTAIPSMKESLDSYEISYYFVNAISTIDISNIVEKACKKIQGKHICIVTTAQHIHMIDKAKAILSNHGFVPYVFQGDNRISEKGQILGCNFSAARGLEDTIDSYLYIGSGFFHPLGLLLSTNKSVVLADPYINKIKTDELKTIKEKVLKQRYTAISFAKNANKFGIIISSKIGQIRSNAIENIKLLLKNEKKDYILIVMDHISSQQLENYRDIDCYISTACPRIAIDDYPQYKVPIITPIELEIAFGRKTYEQYHFDEFLLDE